MKTLTNRIAQFQPFGQWLYFEDGSQEFDAGSGQTTPILTAELYNGKAAKDDNGQWIPAPGPRKHEETFDLRPLLNFQVGLTYIGREDDFGGKAIYDYSVITPTGVAFHGDGKGNTLHVPSHWDKDRVVAEIISWICLGEDSGAEFPEDTTPEQWQWIRSDEREFASADIDELIEKLDQETSQRQKEVQMQTLVQDVEDSRERIIEVRAKEYQERCIHANQTGLVEYLLEKGDHVSWEDVTNQYPDIHGMDADQLAEFISDELGEDWKTLIDIEDYIEAPEDDEEPIDPIKALVDLTPGDLWNDDVDDLRDFIQHADYQPREIFEWYLVDSWLASELEALGHPTLTDGYNHWWGRRTTGQYILMDGVLQQIAAKYV